MEETNRYTISEEEINNFLKYKLLEYETPQVRDDDLWDAYHEDFNTFTVAIFKDCSQKDIRNLRYYL
jgi:hypothetical protein